MRLPFWVDYHYRMSRREKKHRLFVLGWLTLAAVFCFLLIPRCGHWLELRSLACDVDSRVAAAEEARPAAASGAGQSAGAAAELRFSAGPGLEALTDRCAAERVAVADYRPFRPAGDDSGAAEALELGLEGPYSGVKTVLLWLENGPAKAEIRHLEVAGGGGTVTVMVRAIQRVKPSGECAGDPPVFERRPDIFSRRG